MPMKYSAKNHFQITGSANGPCGGGWHPGKHDDPTNEKWWQVQRAVTWPAMSSLAELINH